MRNILAIIALNLVLVACGRAESDPLNAKIKAVESPCFTTEKNLNFRTTPTAQDIEYTRTLTADQCEQL